MGGKLELAILWEPENLKKNNGYFSFLSIVTNGLVTTYKKGAINKRNIRNLKAGFSFSYNDFLESICEEDNQQFIGAAEQMFKKSGGDAGVERLVTEQIKKHIYQQLQIFARQRHPLMHYQWGTDPKTQQKRLEICELLDSQVAVHFEIQLQGGNYRAVPFVDTEAGSRPLLPEDRYDFMVPDPQLRQVRTALPVTKGRGKTDAPPPVATVKQTWRFLSYRDYRTLQWLEEIQSDPQNLKGPVFTERIVQKLERDYRVETNGHFPVQLIEQPPQCIIHLSELNDSFLVFMPRWRYEHLTVEGSFEPYQDILNKGINYRITRDDEVESQFIQYVQSLHPSFPGQVRRGFYYVSFAEARKRQWFLKVFRKLLTSDVQITGLDGLRNFRYSPHEPRTVMQLVSSQGTSVTISLKVHFDKEQIPALTIQKTLLAGQHNVLLKDDSIAVFPEEWQQQYGVIIKHAVIEKDKLQVPSWLFWEQRQQQGDTQVIAHKVLPESWRSKWQRWQQEDVEIYPVPTGIQAKLRPYQRKGYEWMMLLAERQAGACLADDMGLGKTLQTLCFLARQWEEEPGQKSIVICPASLLHNWEQELNKYLPSKKACVYRGPGRDFDAFMSGDEDLLIVSYGTARMDIEKLSSYQWRVAIIDESHHIKNARANITKAVSLINAVNKVALSGTPVMNNTFDLYAQLNFVLPGLLGSKHFFHNEYVIPIDKEGDQSKMTALRNLTNPFILRRTKDQVAGDLPQRTESTLWCEMDERQRFYYEAAKMDIRNSVFLDVKNEGLGKARFSIIQGLQRLRQICNAPKLLKDYQSGICEESVKVELLMDRLSGIKEEGAKALVFSQYTGMLDLIAAACDENEIGYYHFDGSTPTPKRHEMVSQFQREEDDRTAFLISLKAGNAGLNLTAAQYVFLVDPWWNNAVEQQAIDRTHRIGQQRQVFAYRMICKDTVEEKILAIQQKKKMVSDELIVAEEGFVKQITEEDLVYLFS